jgi:hypothetical protein
MTTIQIKQHYIEIAEIIGNKISEKFGTESEPHANGFTNNQMGVLSELMMLDIFSDPVHIGFYHEGMPPFDWDIFAGGISYDVKSSAKKQFCISKKIIDENREIDKFILVYIPNRNICQYEIIDFDDVKNYQIITSKKRPNEPFYSITI